jgi:hypothetical protein
LILEIRERVERDLISLLTALVSICLCTLAWIGNHDAFFDLLTCCRDLVFVSEMMMPRIPTLTKKKRIPEAHSPGTKVE